MTERRSNGGSAFPTAVPESEDFRGVSGMTLRDYFAAKAMQAHIAAVLPMARSKAQGEAFFEMLPTRAYEVADAMLKARQQ